MKRRLLERRMKELGWWFTRHGGRHDEWTNGVDTEYVPRHADVNEMLAKAILRKAAAGKVKEKKK